MQQLIKQTIFIALGYGFNRGKTFLLLVGFLFLLSVLLNYFLSPHITLNSTVSHSQSTTNGRQYFHPRLGLAVGNLEALQWVESVDEKPTERAGSGQRLETRGLTVYFENNLLISSNSCCSRINSNLQSYFKKLKKLETL